MAIRRILAVAALAILSPMSVAYGQDFNVTSAAELTTALATAQASPAADRIFLAAGTYSGSGTGFSYSGASPVEIIGAGQALTTLTALSPAGWALSVGGGGQNRVAQLTAVVPPNGFPQQRAIIFAGGTIEDVSAEADPVVSTTANAIQVTGASTVARVTVTGASSRGIEVDSGGTATISDSVVTGPGPGNGGRGIEATGPTAVATVLRTRVRGHGTAFHAAFGGTLTIRDSVAAVGASATALAADDNNNPSDFSSSIVAERVTIVGSGANTKGVSVTSQSAGDNMSAVLRDTALVGLATPLSCSEVGMLGVAAIVTDHSNLSLTGTSDTCGPGGITHISRTEFPPGFVDQAAEDYRLRFDSPLRDIGRPDPLPPGTLDLARLARPVDGDGDGIAQVDIGAFEYQRRPPIVTATSTPTAAGIGTPFTFDASAVDPDPGESAVSFSWRFDDASVASGPHVTHAFGTAGAHSAAVTVADTAGVSATAVVNVTVRDTTPPVIGGLRAAPSILSGRALPRLGRRYRKIIRFTLSEDARVSARFERRVRRTWRLVPGAFAVAAKKGTNGLRFAGRLSTRLRLRPGTYRIRLRATDAAGNRSRFARARFTLIAPP